MRDLEQRWDERFSQMETAIRTGLTQSSSAIQSVGGASVSAPPAAAAVVTSAVPKSSKASKPKKKSKKHLSPSPELSSSDD